MFIVSLNYTKFNSRHLLAQQIFTLSSIVITIDDKNYFNETMVTGSCLDHSDVKGLVAFQLLQVLSCISSCWELAGRAVVSNCSLCGSFPGFAIFPAWELPGWTFASLAWCIFGCRKHFSHEITFCFTILQQKGIGNTLVMRFCLLSFGQQSIRGVLQTPPICDKRRNGTFLTLKGGYRKIFLFFHKSRWA